MDNGNHMIKRDAPGISARSAPTSRHAPAASGLRCFIGLCIALFLPGVSASLLAAEDPTIEVPEPERVADAPPPGVKIGRDITLSGYATVQFLAPDVHGQQAATGSSSNAADEFDDNSQFSRRARLSLSHLSGIAWWEPSPAWKMLAEIDLQDVLQVPGNTQGNDDDGSDSSPYVALERLYVDYRASDSVSFRVGKFLTPIGRWNQEHSDPQVWTVLRPLISESAFPTNATGVMVFGSLPIGSQWIDYQTYASDGGDLRSSPRSHPFDRAIGGRISTALNPDLQVGVSLSRFTQSDFANTEFNLVGVDAVWTWRRTKFSGEVISRHGNDGNTAEEHGWFAQAVTPISDRWWAVARLEAYQRAVDATENRTALVGIVYRSGSHWVFKAEWAQPSRDAAGLPSGLLSSLTLVY
jgi:hypothetical protein